MGAHKRVPVRRGDVHQGDKKSPGRFSERWSSIDIESVPLCLLIRYDDDGDDESIFQLPAVAVNRLSFFFSFPRFRKVSTQSPNG